MFSKMKKTNALIGIDFGSNSIKAIAISKGKGTFQIDAVVEAPIAKGLIVDILFDNITSSSSMILQPF